MNVPIDSWFRRWSAEHYTLCRKAGVPKPDGDEGQAMFRVLLKVFAARKVTEDAARAATERIALDPPPIRKHIGAVIQAATEAMRADGGHVEALPIDDTHESARAASEGCPHCGAATGLAPVVLRNPDESARVRSTCAYCVCRLGRWVRRTHERHSPDVFRRVPDLAEVLAGRSAWMSPEAPEEACLSTTTSAPW